MDLQQTNLYSIDSPSYDLLFNYNSYSKRWYCFTREDYRSYFSNRDNPSSKIASGLTQNESYINWKTKYLK